MKGGIGHSIFFLKGELQHTHNGEALQIGLLEVKQSNLRVQEKEGKLHRKVTPCIQQTRLEGLFRQRCLHSWWRPKILRFQDKTLLGTQRYVIRRLLFVKSGTNFSFPMVFRMKIYENDNGIDPVTDLLQTRAQKTPKFLKTKNWEKNSLNEWWHSACYWVTTPCLQNQFLTNSYLSLVSS